MVRPSAGRRRVFSTHLIGPRNPKMGADLRVDITLRVDPKGRRVMLQSEGTPRELEIRQRMLERLAAGQIQARPAAIGSGNGPISSRSKCEPELALYASPVNFDPDSPFFPISEPPEYAGDLADQIGLYYTTGMVEDHAGLEQRTDLRRDVSRPVRDRLARARGDDAARAGIVRRGAVLLPVRHARPRPAPVLAIRRARSSGQPRRGARSEFARVIDDCYRRCDASSARRSNSATTRHCSSRFPTMDSTVSSAAFI